MGLRWPFRLSTTNLARLVLSLLIAFGIWAFVTNDRDPDWTRTFADVPVEARGLSNQFQIVESLPDTQVTFKGPQSVVQGITETSIAASIDLSNVEEAGEYERTVQVTDPGGLRDIETDPETVVVNVDTVVNEVFDITVVEPADSPASLTSISIFPSQVRLVGVQQNVERVDRVEVAVQLSGRTESFSYSAQPIVFDSDGIPMTDTVRVEPPSVQVSVEFEVRARTVPVIVQCACRNDDGELEIQDLPTAIAIPPTVRIEGPEPLLAQVNAVRTVPISIEALEESGFLPDGAELDDAALPEGVTLERGSVGVYVEVEQAIQEITQTVEVINAPPNMRVALAPQTVTFEVQGPQDMLATLATEPPMVVVDLSDFDEGTHILAPRVVLPPDIRVVNLEPAEVQVTIATIPPTPTPEPPPPTTTPEASLLPNSSPMRSGGSADDDTGE